MATIQQKEASFQPAFPRQYPEECQSCKTPNVCEKILIKGRKRNACIFVCPNKQRRFSSSKSKAGANMVTDSEPGLPDFVTKKGKAEVALPLQNLICPIFAIALPGPGQDSASSGDISCSGAFVGCSRNFPAGSTLKRACSAPKKTCSTSSNFENRIDSQAILQRKSEFKLD